MDSEQLAEARRRVGWSQEEMAASLGVPVGHLREWEAKEKRIPRHVEEKLAWAEYEVGVRAAGIAVCRWAANWDATPFPADDEGMLESLQEMEEHEKQCPICRARQQYAEQHPPPNNRDLRRNRGRVLTPVADVLARLPDKLRPVATGALLSGALAVLGVLAEAIGSPHHPDTARNALVITAAALIGGAAGGGAYVATLGWSPWRGRSMNYVGGVAAASVCFAVFLLVVQFDRSRATLDGPRDWMWAGFLTLMIGFGLAIGGIPIDGSNGG